MTYTIVVKLEVGDFDVGKVSTKGERKLYKGRHPKRVNRQCLITLGNVDYIISKP